jgi:hypothetical protein
MKQHFSDFMITPTVRQNMELARAGWRRIGKNKYLNSRNFEANRRVALVLARKDNWENS